MEQTRVAANGIPVYSYRQPHLHSFCIGLYVKAGALYEKPEEAGITHFLEHVLFRNLGGLAQRELYEALEGMGAVFNACTYKEFVQFYITATPRHFAQCAALIAKLLLPLTATQKDVATERKRIRSEIREKDDLHSIEHFAKQQIWKGTRLTGAIAGTVTGVGAISLDMLREEKQRNFVANNLFFYVTGSFADAGLDGFVQEIGQRHIEAGGIARDNCAALPQGFGNRGGAAMFRDCGGIADVLVSFDVDYTRYGLAEINLLYDLLFGGNLCRFNLELSENRGLIYGYDAYLEQYSNIGVIYVEYSVLQSRLQEALSITVDLFRSLKQGITGQELSLFLPEYTDNAILALDNPQRLNWDMAYNNHILNKGYRCVEELPELYKAVAPERLMEMAREIFRPENLVAAFKCRRGKRREETLREILLEL